MKLQILLLSIFLSINSLAQSDNQLSKINKVFDRYANGGEGPRATIYLATPIGIYKVTLMHLVGNYDDMVEGIGWLDIKSFEVRKYDSEYPPSNVGFNGKVRTYKKGNGQSGVQINGTWYIPDPSEKTSDWVQFNFDRADYVNELDGVLSGFLVKKAQ